MDILSQKYSKAILNNTTEGMVIFDADNKIVFVNEAASEIAYFKYYSDSNLQPRDVFDFYTVDGSRLLQEDELIYTKMLNGIELRNFEQLIKLKDDLPAELSALRQVFIPKSLSVSSRIIRGESEELVGTIISYKDITEQKKHEQKLIQEQDFINIVLNNTTEGISVFDANGKKKYINEAARELTGLSSLPDITDLQIENPFEFYTIDGKRKYSFEELPLGLGIQGIEVENFEEIIQLKDVISPELSELREIFKARYLSVNSRIIRDNADEIESIVISYRDITKEKLLEEQTFIKSILENTSEGITNLSVEGDVIYTNSIARKMFAIDKYKNITNYSLRSVFDLYDADSGKLLTEEELPLDLALKGVEIDNVQVVIKVSDNLPEDFTGLKKYFGTKVFSISSSNITSNKGELTSVVFSYKDITQRKQNEEALTKTRQRLAGSREEERRHLARELHDSIIQDLMAYSYEFANIEHLITTDQEEKINLQDFIGMRQKLTMSIKELRRFISGLRPVGLEEFGFYSAISSYIALLERDTTDKENFPVFSFDMDTTTEIPIALNLCLYRSAQESLANIVRHARANNVLIQLKRLKNEEKLVLTIKDDGIGFDVPKDLSDLPTKNFGLIGIAERVELVEGQFLITSEKEKGTTIVITLPCDILL